MLITLAQLNFTVGKIEQNYNQIISAIEKAKEDGSDIVVTTEMALTGYPPLDLLLQPGFLETVDHYLNSNHIVLINLLESFNSYLIKLKILLINLNINNMRLFIYNMHILFNFMHTGDHLLHNHISKIYI